MKSRPAADGTRTESDTDNNGVVLKLIMGKISFLFTADIQWEAEFELMSHHADLTSTVLKIAHHGSDTSTTSEFLSVVNPQLAMISVSNDNRFGHPATDVLTKLYTKTSPENIFRTDICSSTMSPGAGDVVVFTSGGYSVPW